MSEGLSVSERRACKVLGQYRTRQRHVALVKSDEETLINTIVGLVTHYGRYGYKQVTGLLREASWRINKKRVERIWRRGDCSCARLRPLYPNLVLACNFVAVRTYDG